MKSFFEHKCHKCGLIDEAKFVHAGPHIKQVCNGCGFYVCFFEKSKIPNHLEIKQKIWFISNQNLDLINKAKQEVEYFNCTGLSRKLMYWKVYLKVREYVQKGETV